MFAGLKPSHVKIIHVAGGVAMVLHFDFNSTNDKNYVYIFLFDSCLQSMYSVASPITTEYL